MLPPPVDWGIFDILQQFEGLKFIKSDKYYLALRQISYTLNWFSKVTIVLQIRFPLVLVSTTTVPTFRKCHFSNFPYYRESLDSAVFWSPANRTIWKTALIEHWFSTKIAIWDFWVFKVHFFCSFSVNIFFWKCKPDC